MVVYAMISIIHRLQQQTEFQTMFCDLFSVYYVLLKQNSREINFVRNSNKKGKKKAFKWENFFWNPLNALIGKIYKSLLNHHISTSDTKNPAQQLFIPTHHQATQPCKTIHHRSRGEYCYWQIHFSKCTSKLRTSAYHRTTQTHRPVVKKRAHQRSIHHKRHRKKFD